MRGSWASPPHPRCSIRPLTFCSFLLSHNREARDSPGWVRSQRIRTRAGQAPQCAEAGRLEPTRFGKLQGSLPFGLLLLHVGAETPGTAKVTLRPFCYCVGCRHPLTAAGVWFLGPSIHAKLSILTFSHRRGRSRHTFPVLVTEKFWNAQNSWNIPE